MTYGTSRTHAFLSKTALSDRLCRARLWVLPAARGLYRGLYLLLVLISRYALARSPLVTARCWHNHLSVHFEYDSGDHLWLHRCPRSPLALRHLPLDRFCLCGGDSRHAYSRAALPVGLWHQWRS